MFDFIKNKTVFAKKYHTHSEAVVISCFFNPQNSPYRLKAFKTWYESIKHLNHSIIECVIGDAKPQLEESKNIKRVYTENLLWHKETLLNKIIAELPKKYKYVFWVDADVLFTNLDWMVDGVKELQTKNIIQPFEYCVHLERDEDRPSFFMNRIRATNLPNLQNSKVWRSFCANFATSNLWESENYNDHGHVGFAWGAKRYILEAVPLYDRALIGGADHIIAHASAGQIGHNCITKSFTDNIDEINDWSKQFYKVVNGKIGFVKGDLYHIWHGDIEKRQYLKRIQEFTPKTKQIIHRDENGLFVTTEGDDEYVKNYFKQREVTEKTRTYKSNRISLREAEYKRREEIEKRRKEEARIELRKQYPNSDDSFIESMIWAYLTDSTLMGSALGGNVAGAIIGDMLNNSDEPKQDFDGFGGGSFGGSGAGGSYENESNFGSQQNDILDTNSQLGAFS